MTATLTLTLHASIHEIAAADWDLCAGWDAGGDPPAGGATPDGHDTPEGGGGGNPFVSHAFLSAVEDSGSTGKRTGWLPQHAAFRDAAGTLVACAPTYVKAHSYGEYVFDHGWAHAFERAGGDYYPKLLVASPFSPVPGPRLLRRTDVAAPPIAAIAAALADAGRSLDLSSVHVNFCTEAEWGALGEAGWLRRVGMQFHWSNAGYADFDAFLGALNSRKRKAIRRERRDAQDCGLQFRTLRGSEATRADWAAFHRFYMSTVDRKWGSAYLTERFFPLLGQRLGDRVVLMLADHDGTPVAGALNLMGRDALYGRNWGCTGDWPFLHFELCYYRAIEFAIAHGLARVEAGAQGEHKIQRGYLPTPTYSAHWIAHGGLRRAVAAALDEERPAMFDEMAALAELSPFRQGE